MSKRSSDNAIEVYADSEGYRMTRGEVKQQCGLSGVARLLGYSSPLDLKDALAHKKITEYQVAEKIINARKLKGVPPSAPKGHVVEPVSVAKKPSSKGSHIYSTSIEDLLEGRLAEYASYFDWEDLAPNNKMSLERLAMFEVNADILSRRITYLLNTEEYAEDTIVLIGQLRKELVEFNNKIESTEKSLGIDISSREHRKQRSTGVEAHKAIVKEAAKWMWQKMTQYEHCGEKLGFGVLFFDNPLNLTQIVCPRCGETVSYRMKAVAIQFDPGLDQDTGLPKITYLEQADADFVPFNKEDTYEQN